MLQNLQKYLKQAKIKAEIKFTGERIEKTFKILGAILLVLAILIGAYTRLYGVFAYNQFRDDQSRDAFVYLEMSQGKWPTLGPASSVGGYSLSPIYYILNYLVSFGSLDPAWQAFPNSLFEFLSIPLFFYFLLLLLNGLKSGRSWLIAGFATLWWSVFFNDMIFGGMEWNPSSIPFFMLAFVTILKSAITSISIFKDEYTLNPNFKFVLKPVLLWVLTGFITAILMALHSTTLLVIPVVLFLAIIYTVWKDRFYAFPVVSAWVAVLLAHSTYFAGELGRNWHNTTTFIQLVLLKRGDNGSIPIPHTAFQRVNRVLFNYLDLGDFGYFDKLSLPDINRFFLSIVLALAVIKFKGNRLLWAILWAIWLLYSFAVSNFWSFVYVYYKFPIWLCPIIFVAVILNYFDLKKLREWILVVVVLIFSLNSIYYNTQMANIVLDSRLNSSQRATNTYDMLVGLSSLADQSIVCADDFFYQPLAYIAKARLPQKSLQIVRLNQCQTQNNVIKIYPKFWQWDDLKMHPEPPLDQNQITKVYFENEAVLFYLSR